MKRLIGFLLVVLLAYGCTQTPMWEKIAQSYYNRDIVSESADLTSKVESSPDQFESQSANYELKAIVTYEKEEVERLRYEITLDWNTVTMKQVKFSTSLHPQMFMELDTSNVFFSNVYHSPHFQTIEPLGSGKVKGLVLGRAFVFNPDTVSPMFQDIYQECYVKVTWTSKDHQVHQDYIKIQATPTQELLDVLAKRKKS